MKNKDLFKLLIIICLSILLISCTSTKAMVSGVAVDPDLTVPEKMEVLDIPKVMVSRPETLYSGDLFVDRLCIELEKAQDYIIISSFLSSECDENQKIYDALKEKSEEGVKVFFISDGSSPFDMTESQYHLRPITSLIESGVQILINNPITLDRLSSPISLLYRDHRKYMDIDGKELFVGGMNLNYASDIPSEVGGNIDLMYIFHSSDVAALMLDDFIEYWNDNCVDEVSRKDFTVPERREDETITAWFVNQYGAKKNMSKVFGVLINSAKEQISFLPYLPFLNNDMLAPLTSAAKKGLDVQLLNSNHDIYPEIVSNYYISVPLIESGVKVFMQNSEENFTPLIHQKLLVTDKRYVFIGSSNYNYRSMNLSNEIGLIVDDQQFAQESITRFNQLKEISSPVSLEFAKKYRNLSIIPFYYIFGFFGG